MDGVRCILIEDFATSQSIWDQFLSSTRPQRTECPHQLLHLLDSAMGLINSVNSVRFLEDLKVKVSKTHSLFFGSNERAICLDCSKPLGGLFAGRHEGLQDLILLSTDWEVESKLFG